MSIKLEPVGSADLSCYTSLAQEPITAEHAETVAKAFKALSDPVRVRLLSLIASHAGGEACVCDLTEAFDLTQPTISHHLKVLREAGLVTSQRRATWVYYRIDASVLGGLADTLTAKQAVSA